jgi:hemolysin activation/secretion protein
MTRTATSTVPAGGLSKNLALACAAGCAVSVVAIASAQPAVAPSGPGSATAQAELPAALAEDGATHTIANVDIEFAESHPDHPRPQAVLAAEVSLTRTQTGWVAPLPGKNVRTFTLAQVRDLDEQRFHDSALTLLIRSVATRLSGLDLLGTYAEVDPAQFRVENNRVIDTRPAGDTSLRVIVTTGVVTDVRTSAIGDRIDEEDGLINNEKHERILRNSPIRPIEGETPPLLRRRAIEDHALRLSRHPGRRVDISIAPSAFEPGAVTLDYLVTENKPWLVYFQLSNTGTESTNEWQQRFGFIDNQLTDADDTLSLEFTTNSFDGTNSASWSYERPLANEDRLRARVYGSWYEYDASAVGQPGADFEGDGVSLGLEAIYNVLQHRDWFVDTVAGLRVDWVDVNNELAGVEGDDTFVVGYAGARLDRTLGNNRTAAEAIIEFSIDGVDGDAVNTLGRAEADEDWVVLRAAASQSVYLETIFSPELAETASLAHEVYVGVRGQYSFDNRLVPNYQSTAGGLYTVRGYDQSIVAGDDAIIATGEYRFHLPRALAVSEAPGELFGEPFRWQPQYKTGPTDWDLLARGFIDVARVENADRFAFEQDETLVGVGFGLELSIRRNLSARVDFGWALEEIEDQTGQTIVDKGDSEVHFVLTVVY